MRKAVLDDIIFQLAPLGEHALTTTPALDVHVRAADGLKGFSHPLPLFARRPSLSDAQPHWPAYCGLLRDFGVPLQTSVASLERLSVANVPLRLARRNLDEAFDSLEIETAEALEISCIAATPGGALSQLPLEAAAWHDFKVLVECVRDLSGGSTPIGLGMLVGDVSSDVANALATRVDFIILQLPQTDQELSSAELDLLVWSVAAARSACIQAGAAHFPIYVDAAVTRSDDFIKLLALGASAVAIDALAAACLPVVQPAVNLPHGMLSGIGGLAPASVPSLKPLERKLAELIETLKTRLRQLQLTHIGQLSRDHLRALSEQAARLSGVRSLSQ